MGPHGPDATAGIWTAVAQFGFNALLVVVLLYYGRLELREIRRENLRESRANRAAGERNNRLTTLALLQIATMPGIVAQLEQLKKELEEAQQEERDEAAKERGEQ